MLGPNLLLQVVVHPDLPSPCDGQLPRNVESVERRSCYGRAQGAETWKQHPKVSSRKIWPAALSHHQWFQTRFDICWEECGGGWEGRVGAGRPRRRARQRDGGNFNTHCEIIGVIHLAHAPRYASPAGKDERNTSRYPNPERSCCFPVHFAGTRSGLQRCLVLKRGPRLVVVEQRPRQAPIWTDHPQMYGAQMGRPTPGVLRPGIRWGTGLASY